MRSRLLTVRDDEIHWFDVGDSSDIDLRDLDVVLMRKDPPFDMEYIYTSYILERAEDAVAVYFGLRLLRYSHLGEENPCQKVLLEV